MPAFLQSLIDTVAKNWVEIVLGALGTILSALITLFVSRLVRSRKHLAFGDKDNRSVIQLPSTYHWNAPLDAKQPLPKDTHLFVVKLINKGELILIEDFAQPIVFSFGSRSQVRASYVWQTKPRKIPVTQTSHGNHVVMHPVMMNQKDEIYLVFLVRRARELRVRARLAGMSRIHYLGASAIRSTRIVTLIGIALFLLTVGWYSWGDLKQDPWNVNWFGGSLLPPSAVTITLEALLLGAGPIALVGMFWLTVRRISRLLRKAKPVRVE